MNNNHTSQKEIEKIIQEAKIFIPIHTDVIFALNGNDTSPNFSIRSQGTGILVKFNEITYLLTAAHVHRNGNIIISGAFKKSTPRITTDNTYKVQSLKLYKTNPSNDYSIFTNYPTSVNTCKKTYDLTLSLGITQELIKNQIPCMSFSLGYLGELREVVSDSSTYIDTNIQSIIISGPIIYVDNDRIVVDCTPKETEPYTEEAKQFLNSLSPTNKCFPFYGCSGCGLWIRDEEGTFILVGLMKGKADCSTTQHNVEFIPIWKIIETLQ